MPLRLLSRFRKQRPSALPVPTFAQIEPNSRLLIPSLVAIAAALGAYWAWPEQKPLVPPVISTLPAPLPVPPTPSPAVAAAVQTYEEPAPRKHEKTIYTGPRGGRYHYSASGNKVYERKRLPASAQSFKG